MKLHEYQAKALLQRDGVDVPRNAGAVETPEAARSAVGALGGRAVLKAQVHTGGRGKAGGIRVAESPEQAFELAHAMLGMLLKTHQAPQGLVVSRLLVEEPIELRSEFYFGIVPDRTLQRNVLIVSAMGGMDIEAVADEHPEAIARVAVDPATGIRPHHLRRAAYEARLPREIVSQFVSTAGKLYRVYRATDASLVEVNPLAVTADGRLLAADAKITIDDNALFRHPDLVAMKDEAEEDAIEAEAARRGLQYVRLDGTVGVIGNGAGLVMTTLDEIARAGGRAANFLDVGGGAKAEVVRNSLELVLMNPNVRGVLVNIFGGITRCDEVARGILSALEGLRVEVPMVVRLAGTRAPEGAAILAGSPVTPAGTMQEAAAAIVRLAAA